MGAKCKIVPLDMIGGTENGTVNFSADKIAVIFQFIGINKFGFEEERAFKYYRQSTIGTLPTLKATT